MLMWPLKPRRKDRSVAAARQAGRHGAVGPVAGRTSASSAIQRTGRPLAVVYRARFSLESGPRCRIPGRARSPAARSTSRRLGRPMSSPCRIVTRAGTSTRARARGYPPKAAAAAWWRGLRPRRRDGITGLVAAHRPASRGWLSRSGATEPAGLVCGPRAECQCLSDLSPGWITSVSGHPGAGTRLPGSAATMWARSRGQRGDCQVTANATRPGVIEQFAPARAGLRNRRHKVVVRVGRCDLKVCCPRRAWPTAGEGDAGGRGLPGSQHDQSRARVVGVVGRAPARVRGQDVVTAALKAQARIPVHRAGRLALVGQPEDDSVLVVSLVEGVMDSHHPAGVQVVFGAARYRSRCDPGAASRRLAGRAAAHGRGCGCGRRAAGRQVW